MDVEDEEIQKILNKTRSIVNNAEMISGAELIEEKLKGLIYLINQEEVVNRAFLLDRINEILNSNFFDEVCKYLKNTEFIVLNQKFVSDDSCSDETGDYPGPTKRLKFDTLPLRILNYSIELASKIIQRTPSKIEYFDQLFDRIELVLDKLKNDDLTQLFKTKVLNLKQEHNDRQNKFKRKIIPETPEPPESFKEISIIPLLDELKSSEKLYLRPNKPFGRFKNVQEYLDIHFRLLREDYVASLREGITEYLSILQINMKNRKNALNSSSIRIYDNVKINKYVNSRNDFVHEIQFEMTNRLSRVKWENSKRLIQGSLLCLTNDDFQTAYFAVVYDRKLEDLKNGKLLVKFNDWISINNEIIGNYRSLNNFTMIETLTYFESYRYTLEALKSFDEDNFPFKKYIVYCENDVIDSPKYLKNDVVNYDFRPLMTDKAKILKEDDFYQFKYVFLTNEYSNVPVLEKTLWPTFHTLGLNESQYNALQAALTNELVVIQGPPGTGKTFVTVQIIKILLHNYDKLGNKRSLSLKRADMQCNSPILVVSYTNFALDQLLNNISQFLNINSNEMIRVGGRCKDENLKKLALHELKKSQYDEIRRHFKYSPVFKSLKKTVRILDAYTEKLKNADNQILDFNEIHMFCKTNKLSTLFSSDIITYYKAIGFQSPTKNQIFKDWLGIGDLNYEFNKIYVKEVLAYFNNTGQLNEEMEVTNFDYFNQNNEDDDDKISVEDFEDIEDGIKNAAILNNKNMNNDNENDNNNNLEEAMLLNTFREIDEDIEEKQDVRSNMNLAHHYSLLAENDIGSKTNLKLNQIKSLEYIAMDEAEYENLVDLWMLEPKDRIRLYKYLVNEYKKKINKKINDNRENYRKHLLASEGERDEDSLYVLRNAKVIGMTTTGAAKNLSLLKLLKPKIVIAEEAAEVFESHIITCLSESCEHLVLVGDSVQLRPTPDCYKLAKDYHLDVSLFERLINNKMPKIRLNLQRRMRPEISFLMKHFYDDLLDDDSVKNYENVNGIEKNMFFIDHNYSEEGDEDSATKSNVYEAQYLARLCDYLLKQNYEAHQITILVAYGGQLFTVKNKIADLFLDKSRYPHPDLKKVRITPIDNYQGEENDVILLSLVRSNDYNSIGFLGQSNRICVALSRAKKGFYIIGNFEHFRKKSKLWSNILHDVRKKQLISKSLKLCCQKHRKELQIKAPIDFDLSRNGGCDEDCDDRLECGHKCEFRCHVLDHKYIECNKPCTRLLKGCTTNHKCQEMCKVECKPCEELVVKKLPKCDHNIVINCVQDVSDVKCQKRVTIELKCGHFKTIECHKALQYKELTSREDLNENEKSILKSEGDFICREAVEKKLNCEHTIMIKCFESTLSDFFCPVKVEVTLECGHRKSIECFYKKKYETLKANEKDQAYFQRFKNDKLRCEKPMKRKFFRCGHEVELKCCVPIENIHCNKIVEFEIPKCKHKVSTECFRTFCENLIECKQLITKKLNCGHDYEIECHTNDNLQIHTCQKNCRYILNCGHSCTKLCFECKDDKHSICKKPCEKELICGHLCKLECRLPCFICREKCSIRCPHKYCNMKCFEPCVNCTRPCEWSCKHHKCNKLCYETCNVEKCDRRCDKRLTCKHRCFGMCGESCICILCIKTDLKLDKSKLYFKSFDCNCIIEKDKMDEHMENEAIRLRDIFGYPKCPLCNKSILFSRRYSNLIRSQQYKLKTFISSEKPDRMNHLDKENDLLKFNQKVFLQLQSYKRQISVRSQIYFIQNRLHLFLLHFIIKFHCNQFFMKRIELELYLDSALIKLLELPVELSNQEQTEFICKLVLFYYFYYYKVYYPFALTENSALVTLESKFNNNGITTIDYLNSIYMELQNANSNNKPMKWKIDEFIKPVDSVFALNKTEKFN